MHKIFKLCGSPSEGYWQRTKLPHATSFKPQQPYKRRVTEAFKDFPSSALALIDRLLNIDPERRGSAVSALRSNVGFELIFCFILPTLVALSQYIVSNIAFSLFFSSSLQSLSLVIHQVYRNILRARSSTPSFATRRQEGTALAKISINDFPLSNIFC